VSVETTEAPGAGIQAGLATDDLPVAALGMEKAKVLVTRRNPPGLSIPLQEATFVVTDTETTGTAPAHGRIIEIGAVKIRGGEIVGRFSQLINPERAVPQFITRLTGITTAMLYNQPVAAEVMPRYQEFLGDAVFVAHNLQFDRRFIDMELARLQRPILKNQGLCTLRLARRLLAGLRSKGLASVTDFYGIKINGRHRAGGDAEATALVLLKFLKLLETEHAVTTAQQVLAFQFQPYSRPRKEAKHVRRIREEVLPNVPERPGVYFMKNGRHQILYIGKAKSLRARVRSYFSGIEGHTPHLRELIDKVRIVTWRETPCELSALLLESRLIKEHKPIFNRAQRSYRNRPFIRLARAESFPRVSLTNHLLHDGAEYFGPLGGRSQGELVVDVIDRFFKLRECNDNTFRRHERCLYADMDRCPAPCLGQHSAESYALEVQRVRDFLNGTDSGILERIQEAMKRAASQMEFEQAAQYRDWSRRLEYMLEKQKCVASPVLEHNAVLLLPGEAPEKVQLYFVRSGRHLETLTVPCRPTPGDEKAIRERVLRYYTPEAEPPERYFKPQVDEMRVLAHWMYVYRETLRKVPWEETSSEAFMQRLAAEMERPWTANRRDSGEEGLEDEMN
jgi:DNA polymerase III subunit epsilon